MTTLNPSLVRLVASSNNWIEAEALRQLNTASRLEGVQLAVGLPDLHPGRSCPNGAAFVTEGKVYPFLAGKDIGCGMGLWTTNLSRWAASLDHWTEVRFDLEFPWEGNVLGWLKSNNLPSTACDPLLGTLGRGNHFAELQVVEDVCDATTFAELGLNTATLLLLVHSGSRGLGKAALLSHLHAHGPAGLSEYAEGTAHYLARHDLAVRWAKANRALVAERFLRALHAEGHFVLDACHNSVRPREVDGHTVWVHRKGAAPADEGPLVIPGSRGTLSYLVVPRGDQAATAWSLAHGAGRKWARSHCRARARGRFGASHLTQTPLGGRVICGDRDLLYEEAPLAYKDIKVVIADMVQAGLVNVIATLRPVLTYKSRIDL